MSFLETWCVYSAFCCGAGYWDAAHASRIGKNSVTFSDWPCQCQYHTCDISLLSEHQFITFFQQAVYVSHDFHCKAMHYLADIRLNDLLQPTQYILRTILSNWYICHYVFSCWVLQICIFLRTVAQAATAALSDSVRTKVCQCLSESPS